MIHLVSRHDVVESAVIHEPQTSQKSICFLSDIHYSELKVFSSLPSQIKDLSHSRNQFKQALKNSYILIHFTLWMNILAVIGFKVRTVVQQFFYALKFYLDNC
jgi:hypothetical protein